MTNEGKEKGIKVNKRGTVLQRYIMCQKTFIVLYASYAIIAALAYAQPKANPPIYSMHPVCSVPSM